MWRLRTLTPPQSAPRAMLQPMSDGLQVLQIGLHHRHQLLEAGLLRPEQLSDLVPAGRLQGVPLPALDCLLALEPGLGQQLVQTTLELGRCGELVLEGFQLDSEALLVGLDAPALLTDHLLTNQHLGRDGDGRV